MQWIKEHLNVVIASSVGGLALVALVLGFVLPDVKAEMSQDESLYSGLGSVRGAMAPAIENLRKEQIRNRQELANDLSRFASKETVVHKPLPSSAALFPKPDPNRGTAPFDFKQEFRQRQKDLLAMLKAGDQPTQAEIQEMQDTLAKLKGQAMFNQQTPGDPVRGPIQPNQFGGNQTPFAGPLGGPGGQNLTPEQRMKEDPATRASVNKAHAIWCYATLDNLDQRPAVGPEVARPLLDDMWYAQFSLWVQEDILTALGRLNQEAAQKLAPADQWVGNMPFKQLRSLHIGGFVPPAAGAGDAGTRGGPAPAGANQSGEIGGPPPMNAAVVVTKHGSTDTVDRIHVALDIVIDAKALYYVVNAISTCGFFTILDLSYQAVPPNPTLTGYIYGSQPAIRVYMLIEGSYLRNKYAKEMPETVVAAIKAGTPVVGGGAAPTLTGGFGGQSNFGGMNFGGRSTAPPTRNSYNPYGVPGGRRGHTPE